MFYRFLLPSYHWRFTIVGCFSQNIKSSRQSTLALTRTMKHILLIKCKCNSFFSFFQGVMKVRKRVTKMVLTVSVIYGLCWMPNLTIYALNYFSPSHKYGDVTYITSIVLVTCNSTVNPFIYVFVNQKFRSKIKSLLCCGKSCNNRVEPSSGSSHHANERTNTVTHPTLAEDTCNAENIREANN